MVRAKKNNCAMAHLLPILRRPSFLLSSDVSQFSGQSQQIWPHVTGKVHLAPCSFLLHIVLFPFLHIVWLSFSPFPLAFLVKWTSYVHVVVWMYFQTLYPSVSALEPVYCSATQECCNLLGKPCKEKKCVRCCVHSPLEWEKRYFSLCL